MKRLSVGVIWLVAVFLVGIMYGVRFEGWMIAGLGILNILILFIAGLVGMPASLVYTFGFLFVPAVLTWAVINAIPYFIIKIIEMTLTHPASRPVARTVAQKRPDYVIERELWQIMERQDAGEWEIEKLINEASPLRRWYIRFQYRHGARTAEQLREMAEAKRQAIEEETKLSSSVHELERLRRQRADRR